MRRRRESVLELIEGQASCTGEPRYTIIVSNDSRCFDLASERPVRVDQDLLQSDKITRLGQANRLQGAVSPWIDLLLNIACRFLAQLGRTHVSGVRAL